MSVSPCVLAAWLLPEQPALRAPRNRPQGPRLGPARRRPPQGCGGGGAAAARSLGPAGRRLRMGSAGDPCGRGPDGGAAQRPQQAHGAPARCRRDAGRGTPAASGSRQLGEGGHGPPAPCRLTFRTRIPPGRRDAAASGGSGGSSGPAGPGSTSPMGGQCFRDARPALQRASLGGARELQEASPLRLGPAPNPYTPPLAAPPLAPLDLRSCLPVEAGAEMLEPSATAG